MGKFSIESGEGWNWRTETVILLPAIMTQFLRTQFLSFVLGGILDGYKL